MQELLYHNPQLLVLDEATSALDNNTEQAIMDAVNNLNKNMTIIIIAQKKRLNTIYKKYKIYLIEKGEIKKFSRKVYLKSWLKIA